MTREETGQDVMEQVAWAKCKILELEAALTFAAKTDYANCDFPAIWSKLCSTIDNLNCATTCIDNCTEE